MRPTARESIHCIASEDSTSARDRDVAHAQPDASLSLLVGELQHRIRNLLTVVQCFVNQTEAVSPEGYRTALTSRLANLADAYNLIECAREYRISLTELLARTLKPFAAVRKDRIYIAGPDVELEPQLALSLHMVFHELATNASKHGALASTSGRVEVFWDLVPVGADRGLALQWSERGGPEVHEPKHRGFGLRLITKVLADAQIETNFNPSGFVCRILIETDRRHTE